MNSTHTVAIATIPDINFGLKLPIWQHQSHVANPDRACLALTLDGQFMGYWSSQDRAEATAWLLASIACGPKIVTPSVSMGVTDEATALAVSAHLLAMDMALVEPSDLCRIARISVSDVGPSTWSAERLASVLDTAVEATADTIANADRVRARDDETDAGYVLWLVRDAISRCQQLDRILVSLSTDGVSGAVPACSGAPTGTVRDALNAAFNFVSGVTSHLRDHGHSAARVLVHAAVANLEAAETTIEVEIDVMVKSETTAEAA